MRDFLILGNSCDIVKQKPERQNGKVFLLLWRMRQVYWRMVSGTDQEPAVKYSDVSSAGRTLAVDARWEQYSWLLLLLLSSWLFVLHECPEAPAEKECHCTKHCINIVRGSFAMNNLCLTELRNVKTKRRNSGPEGWDWVLNAWLCFPVPLASLRTRLVISRWSKTHWKL